ncbi:MAG: 4-hydroxy-tetrahydrodipicolinate reductase [Coriobacteriaceae bacterium]|nr:4-hydroxy-tetrahydrodipicolinate reductase [Coriobacteriaceae bacterium]
MIKVLVTGAAGRMGRQVVAAVTAQPDMEVVAAVDPMCAGDTIEDGAGGTIECVRELDLAIEQHVPDVMVDFTNRTAATHNIRDAISEGVHCVVGTTGMTDAELTALAAVAQRKTCLFYAPNFALGAVLMMRFAEQAARFMPHAEIIELHHDQKVDAPSGTAMRTASLIAIARSEVPAAPGRETEVAEGARGAVVDGVPVHSVRLPGLVAHQEVVFGGQGQTLTIRHDSIDRSSFMPGVVLAVRNVGRFEGLVVGLENILGV